MLFDDKKQYMIAEASQNPYINDKAFKVLYQLFTFEGELFRNYITLSSIPELAVKLSMSVDDLNVILADLYKYGYLSQHTRGFIIHARFCGEVPAPRISAEFKELDF